MEIICATPQRILRYLIYLKFSFSLQGLLPARIHLMSSTWRQWRLIKHFEQFDLIKNISFVLSATLKNKLFRLRLAWRKIFIAVLESVSRFAVYLHIAIEVKPWTLESRIEQKVICVKGNYNLMVLLLLFSLLDYIALHRWRVFKCK